MLSVIVFVFADTGIKTFLMDDNCRRLVQRFVDDGLPLLRDVVNIDQERPLGTGAFGVVRVAERQGTRVAVKFLHGIFSSSVLDMDREAYFSLLKQFLEEAALLASFNHPHIIKLYGILLSESDPNAPPSIAMELMSETVRARVLHSPKLSLHSMTQIALQVCSALRYLHERERPIAHRDLSSTNVMLNQLGQCKLVDLGLAKVFRESVRYQHSVKPGQEYYMPPEAMPLHQQETHYTEKIDMFSLGVLILEMGVGHPPAPLARCRPEPSAASHLLAPVPERERRGPELEELGECHPLRSLIVDLLEPEENRPSSTDAYKALHDLECALRPPSLEQRVHESQALLVRQLLEASQQQNDDLRKLTNAVQRIEQKLTANEAEPEAHRAAELVVEPKAPLPVRRHRKNSQKPSEMNKISFT